MSKWVKGILLAIGASIVAGVAYLLGKRSE